MISNPKKKRLRASLSISRNSEKPAVSQRDVIHWELQRQKNKPKPSRYDRKISLCDGHLHIRLSDGFRFMQS